MRWTGWRAFAAWGVSGALLGLSFLGAASIGLFVFPFTLLAAFVTLRRASRWPEAVGVVGGAGAVFLLLAFLNRNYTPCSESSTLTIGPGETSATCGGFDPLPWLIVGLALVGASLVGYALARARRPPAEPRTS
jgi:hypothetical protein